MGLHKGWDRFMPILEGKVMTSGGSLNLAKGQLGIFDIRANTINGVTAVSDFSSAGAKDQFQIRVGNNEIGITRGQANKNKEGRPFKLSEVKDLQVFVPNTNKKVDKYLVGYDGINADTALTFEEGVTELMSIKLEGGMMDILGYENGCAVFNVHFEKQAGQTNQEVVEKAVEEFKSILMKESIPITEAINISVVNSENAASVSGVDHTFYTLEVTDDGSSNALALVQTQFGTKVVRSDRNELVSTYTILVPTADGAPADFSPESGDDISWVEGSTCTAITEEYTIQLADNEVSGDRLSELQAAFPALTIAVKEAATGATSTEVTLTGTGGTANVNVNGTNYLTTFASNLNTTADNFVTAHAAALALEDIVVTADSGVLTFVDESAVAPEIAVTNATGDLAGTVAEATDVTGNVSGICQTVYTTTVTSNVVCEDCSPMLRDSFETEAPGEFDFISWESATPTYSETALMGIKIEGKEVNQSFSEFFRDGIPFINTSTRVMVAGGFRSSSFMSFTEGSGDRFAVKVLSRAEDLENLGGNLWAAEDRDFTYFQGYSRHRDADGHQNEYVKYLLGEESVLKPNAQYITYVLTVQPKSHSQGFAGKLEETFNYTILVEVGKQAAVEALLNNLATNAGIDTVST